MRRIALTALLFLFGGIVLAGPSAAQATVDEAKMFFESFDNQAMTGRGPAVNAVYLPGVATPTAAQLKTAQDKYIADLNEVMAASSARYAVETAQAAGMMPTAAQTKAYADALKKATDSGAIARVSGVQFTIMKTAFPTKDGMGIDFDKVQMAMPLFANGALRVMGAPGTREMDQLWSWYNWKNVAALAIQANVMKDQWTKLLPSIELGLEIYRQAYPPKPLGLGLGAPVTTSEAKGFDPAKKLTAAAIAALAKTINGLTTAEILDREKTNLKTDTKVALAGPPSNGTVTVVSATETPTTGGEQVSLLVDVTNPLGQLLSGDQLEYLVSVDGLELNVGSFWQSGYLTGIGAGEYETSFLAPDQDLGLDYWVSDDSSSYVVGGTIPLAAPEPATFALLAPAVGALMVGRRRTRSAAAE